MKVFLCFALLVFGVALAVPTRQRFHWIEDSNDHLHLVDISAVPSDENDFDGAKDVTFYLFTQKNPEEAEFVKLDDDSTSPSFNPKNPTRVVTHGWTSSVDGLLGFKDAYIATGEELNVLLVDWKRLAAQDAAKSTKSAVQVGDYAGQVLNHLIAARGLDPDRLVIVGHSMGAHVAAVAGNRVGGGSAAELVALDPAAGIFDDNPLEDQLDPSDAKFVQVIHTNAGSVGALENRGHADFFPNGGQHQAGCTTLTDLLAACSHNRAVWLYIESINSKNFVATACGSYDEFTRGECRNNEHVVMGELSPLNLAGTYFLKTNEASPYALGTTEL